MKRRFSGELRNVASILAWARFALLLLLLYPQRPSSTTTESGKPLQHAPV